jgi:hypothetical protein
VGFLDRLLRISLSAIETVTSQLTTAYGDPIIAAQRCLENCKHVFHASRIVLEKFFCRDRAA